MPLLLAASLLVLGMIADQAPPAFERLTMPADRLPEGCTLPPAPTQQLGGDTVRGGLWAGLPMTSNPWIGNDPVIVSAIRERIEPAPAVADGPPLTRAEQARYRLRLAEGVEAAYAAVYADAAQRLVVVYAFQLSGRATPVVTVVGDDSACHAAVATHVKSLR
jgi:hypothetical protein